MSEIRSLSDYEVTFTKGQIIPLWSWTATHKNGDVLESFGFFAAKERAELDAATRIKRHMARETISGAELFERINEREGSMEWQRGLPVRASK